jgi:hypothetical protein
VHALETLKRSTGMHALFMIAESGDVFLAWHDVKKGVKDGGTTLHAWIDEWRAAPILAARSIALCR